MEMESSQYIINGTLKTIGGAAREYIIELCSYL